jgi:putative FmdB family regulatory protein
MPLYKYSCPQCGISFERLARLSQKDEQACSQCGERAARERNDAFAVKATISPEDKVVQTKKEIDLVVGRDSEKRWGTIEEKRKSRREGMVEVSRDVSVSGQGSTFDPNGILGDAGRKDAAKAYNDARKSGDPAATGSDSWLAKADLSGKDGSFKKL